MEDPVRIDPDIMHGAPCFSGTRVPVANLFDLLMRGRTIDYFMEQFPTVRREQVVEVLRRAHEALTRVGAASAA